MKRIISLLIAISMFGTLFVACSTKTVDNTTTDSEAVTVAVTETESSVPVEKKLEGEIVIGTQRTDINDLLQKELGDKFMQENPGVTVTFEAYAADSLVQIVKTRAATNELADICIMPNEISKSDWSSFFLPLDDLGFTEDNLYGYNAGLGVDGKLYGINNAISFPGIVYNKKAFEAAGITVIPRTKDEFLAVCQQLKDKGITPVSTGFKDAWTIGDPYMRDVAFAVSGDPATKNNTLSGDYYAGAFLSGANLMRDLYQKKFIEEDPMSASWDQYKKDLAAGKSAMALMATWLPLQLPEFGANIDDIGMFPIPDAKALVMNRDWNYGIAKSSKSVDVAKAFLQWMFQSSRWADLNNVLPSWKEAKSSMKFAEELKSFELPIIEADSEDPMISTVFNKAAITDMSFIQEYALAKDQADADAVIKKYNDAWVKARISETGK